MRNLKKSLVFLVVLAMILSTVAPVFAATPSDVAGTDYEDAVSTLVSLGIISGYEDGTFQPEKNITRAEFAKIACYVVGLQSAADLAKGTTKFKDVAAGHWASGYINVASEKDMIKGYPDGTFKPEENVSYAEAITILVRALGMGPVVEGKGTWPANYLAKASTAGITDGVSGMVSDAKAIRGAIAKLAWNTLEAEKWGEKEYTTDGIVYGPLGKCLLEDQYKDYAYKNSDGKFVPKSFEDVDVVATQLAGGLEKGKITLSDDSLDDIFGTGVTEKEVELLDKTIDVNSMFGKKVNVLFGKDNKVASLVASNEDVVEGIVDSFDTTDIKIEVNSKEYSFKNDAKIYVDSVDYSFKDGADVNTTIDAAEITAIYSDLVSDLKNSNVKVTLVLDSSKVKAMNMFVADDVALNGLAAAEMQQFIVKEIKSNGEVRDLNDAKAFDMDDITADLDNVVFVKNGKAATKGDLKVGDAVTYVENGDLYYIVITDSKVTGKVTKIATDDGGNASETRRKITIDGKEYTMANDGAVMMTKTGDIEDVSAIDTTVKDFYNKDATLTLNAMGEIVLVSGSVKASATMQVGVVTKDVTESGDNYNVKILGSTGVATSYVTSGEHYYATKTAVIDDATANAEKKDFDAIVGGAVDTDGTPASDELDKADIVVYDVTADGKIDGENLYIVNSHSINDSVTDMYVVYVSNPAVGVTVNDSSMKVTVSGTSYYANSSTTYLNSNASTIEKISGWDSLVDSSNNTILDDATSVYLVVDEDNIIKSIIADLNQTLGSGEEYLNNDADYAIFVEATSETDDDYITVFKDGAEARYVVSGSVYSGVEKGDLIKFEVNGDGEYDGASDYWRMDLDALEDLADTVSGDVYKVGTYKATDKIITFKTEEYRYDDSEVTSSKIKTVKLASDAVVYDVRASKIEKASLETISNGCYVQVDDYDKDDDVYNVVVIFK